MRTYAFLTTKGFRIEVKAKTAREAYKKAKEKNKGYIRLKSGRKIMIGEVTKTYQVFNKEGIGLPFRRLL